MHITSYGFYTLQCRFLDANGQPRFKALPRAGYMHVPYARRDPVGITQWTLEDPPVFDNAHFHWLFVEAGEPDHYYIVNQRSGLCLVAPKKEIELRQDYYAPDRDEEFRFVVERAADSESLYRIESYYSGNPLLVDGGKPDNGQRILIYPDVRPADQRGLGHVVFELGFIGEASHAPGTPGPAAAAPVRDMPRLVSLDQDLPKSFPEGGPPQVTQDQVVPFFMLNDPGLAPYRQIEESPFYTLRGWQRWDKVLDRQFDGRSERETTETVVVGITQFDASSYRSTFKWSVETSAQAGYKAAGFSASLKITAKIDKQVEETTQQSTEQKVNRTRSEQVHYPDLGYPYRIVTWVPTDVYALCRRDSRHPVATWSVTRDGEDVSEIFPATPVKLPRERSAGEKAPAIAIG